MMLYEDLLSTSSLIKEYNADLVLVLSFEA